MSAFSDGAPLRKNSVIFDESTGTPIPPAAELPPLENQPKKSKKKYRPASRHYQAEGPRWFSARVAVYLRYLAYMGTILICSGLTEVFTRGLPTANGGGKWMLFSMATIVIVGAVASLFYTNLRNEIVDKVRSYIFGMALFPGTLIALFLYATEDFLGRDAFSSTLATALPIVFLCTVIIPALVFIKEITGLRSVHRSKLDDEEAVLLWTRQQDGLQR